MAFIKKNWWVFPLIALTIAWYTLPDFIFSLLPDPAYWRSAPGLALRATLRQASIVVLVAGTAAQSILYTSLAITTHRLFTRSQSEPDRDISEQGLPMPDQGASTLARLAALGFTRLGELESHFGIRPGAKMIHWLFVGAEEKVRASVTLWKGMATPGVVLRSDFSDEAGVMTYFPVGPRIKRAGLWVDVNKQDIEATYRLHLAHLQELERDHGSPVQVTTVQQHYERTAVFDKRYGRTLWMSLQTSNTVNLLVILAIAAAILFYLFFLSGTFDALPIMTPDMGFFALALITGVVYFGLAVAGVRRLLVSL